MRLATLRDGMIMQPGYEIDSAVIPSHRLPSVLVETCLDRDIEPHKLLRGTGLFLEDIEAGARMVRPEQCFRLIENARKLGPAELPFLAGHRLFPGNYGAAGTRLTNASHLLDALRILTRFSGCLSPLWAPRLTLNGAGATVYWSDACGGEEQTEFLNALMMTAVTSLCRWLGDRPYPWHYALPGPLNHPEQYLVHWGSNLKADTHTCYMYIDRKYLLAPWPRASVNAARVSEQQAMREVGDSHMGFIAIVDTFLMDNIANNPTLNQMANAFSASPATLKRKFKKHHTHFQERYDRVRQQLAIEWLTWKGCSLDEVARGLNFHDSRNLRRAFKRWTGVLPRALIDAV